MFDPTTSSLTISWDHAEGPVRQYKISYSPISGEPNSRVEIVSNWTTETGELPSQNRSFKRIKASFAPYSMGEGVADSELERRQRSDSALSSLSDFSKPYRHQFDTC